MAARRPGDVVAEHGGLAGATAGARDLRRVAVSGCDRVRTHRRRRRIPAGGSAVPARLACQLVARCRAACRGPRHPGHPLRRRPLAGLPGRARRRHPQPNLGGDHRSRRPRRPSHRQLAARRPGGHRRADRLGRHPGGGDPDRRGRRRQFVSDQPGRRQHHRAGPPLGRPVGRRVGRGVAGAGRPARLPRPDHAARPDRDRLAAIGSRLDHRCRRHPRRPPSPPAAVRPGRRVHPAVSPGKDLRAQQHPRVMCGR